VDHGRGRHHPPQRHPARGRRHADHRRGFESSERPDEGIRVEDNLFYDLDDASGAARARSLLIGDGPSDVVIERNTVSQSGNIVMAYGGRKGQPATARGFVFPDNVIRHNTYGVHGADRAPGRDSLEAFFPGAVFAGNVIAGGRASRYPDGNRFIDADAFDGLFEAPGEGNYRPAAGGLLARATARGRGRLSIGCCQPWPASSAPRSADGG
jgi:hypothetical protein